MHWFIISDFRTCLKVAADNNGIWLASQFVNIINTNDIYLVIDVNAFHVLSVSFYNINEIIHSGILPKE